MEETSRKDEQRKFTLTVLRSGISNTSAQRREYCSKASDENIFYIYISVSLAHDTTTNLLVRKKYYMNINISEERKEEMEMVCKILVFTTLY